MALSDATPVVVNTDGAPLLLTTSYQDLYTVTDAQTHEVYVWVNNYTSAAVNFYWRFKTAGQEEIIQVPAYSKVLAIAGQRFLGSGTTNKIQVKAASATSLVATANANRVL